MLSKYFRTFVPKSFIKAIDKHATTVSDKNSRGGKSCYNDMVHFFTKVDILNKSWDSDSRNVLHLCKDFDHVFCATGVFIFIVVMFHISHLENSCLERAKLWNQICGFFLFYLGTGLQICEGSNNQIDGKNRPYVVDLIVVDIPDGSPIPWKSTSDKNVVPNWNAWNVKYWNYTFSMAEYHLADSGCVVILQAANNRSKKIMNKCLPKSSVLFLHKSWTCINILPLMKVDFVN